MFTEYVQKMHNFACLLGGMKDQYPGSLENLLAKISDTLCDFQSFHLEFVRSILCAVVLTRVAENIA